MDYLVTNPVPSPVVYQPPVPSRPWYHETTEPALFNEWTWSHFAWGMAAKKFGPEHGIEFLGALIIHTIYETIEGFLFPLPHRDASMRNHVGDTIAFVAGWGVN